MANIEELAKVAALFAPDGYARRRMVAAVEELAALRTERAANAPVLAAAESLATAVRDWESEPHAGIGDEERYHYVNLGHEHRMGDLCEAYWDARRAALAGDTVTKREGGQSW